MNIDVKKIMMKNSTDMQYIYEVQVCLFMVNRLFDKYLSQEKQFIIISIETIIIIIIINNNNNNNK